MSDSVRPHRRQPTRLPHPWDSPGKNTGVGYCFLLLCMKVKNGSEVAQSFLTLSNPAPWTVAHQAPLSMGFFRQEYWSGVPLPSPSHITPPNSNSRLNYFEETSHCLPQSLNHFTLPSVLSKGTNPSTSWPILVIFCYFL